MTMPRFVLLTLIFVAYLVPPVAGQGGQPAGKFKPQELVIRLEPGFDIDSINAKYGTFTKGHQTQTDVYLLRVPQGRDVEQLALEISAELGVVYCQPNYYLMAPEGLQRSSPFLDQQVKGDVDLQPAATTLALSSVQELTTGVGVTIALIDGGVEFSHPWLESKPGATVSRWDYVDNDSLAWDEPGGSCTGHGTFVAGILRLVAPAATINVYRVLDTAGLGDGFSISSAVLKALDDGCDVINLSLGMSGVHDGLDEALRLAAQNGVFIVASAGNDSTDLASLFPFPASREYCSAIAALDTFSLKADFSNYGLKVDLCAPGTWIYGPFPDSMYAWWDGTSFSAPFVSGVAALARSAKPSLSMAEIDSLMRVTAISLDSLNPAFAGLLGQGRINPLALIRTLIPIRRGDWTADAVVDGADLASMIAYLTAGGQPPSPLDRGDLNCDSVVNSTDLAVLVAYLEGASSIICTGI